MPQKSSLKEHLRWQKMKIIILLLVLRWLFSCCNQKCYKQTIRAQYLKLFHLLCHCSCYVAFSTSRLLYSRLWQSHSCMYECVCVRVRACNDSNYTSQHCAYYTNLLLELDSWCPHSLYHYIQMLLCGKNQLSWDSVCEIRLSSCRLIILIFITAHMHNNCSFFMFLFWCKVCKYIL